MKDLAADEIMQNVTQKLQKDGKGSGALEIMPREADETARSYISRVLVHNIVNLNLKPGEQIQETDFCSLLSVSRTPVREAILELAQVKIIDVYPQRGTYVSLIDPDMVEQARYLRYVLESDLAVTACDLCDQETIDRLTENIQLEKLYNGKNPDKLFQLDQEFHYEIYRLCHKEFLYRQITRMSIHFDRARKLSYIASRPILIVQDHEKIVDALAHRDKKMARRVSRKHLCRSIDDAPILEKKYPDYFVR